ncbi:unnamed protein product [Durusdinium trenchii]|uniref:Uncharacterized protein n=1 Tax=Durusdinium trenchii TaxID=1381693 RepID=A0ABP0LXN6_9DINO
MQLHLWLLGWSFVWLPSRAVECNEIDSCTECFRSGCFGWFGTECCSKEHCLMAAQGDRNFFTSCYEWKQHEDLSQICSAIHDDPCACLEAGCVAQEVSMGSTACFAAYQPAAGRQIFAADLASECEAPFGEAVLP